MEDIKLLNKKFMFIAIFLVSLLAVSAVGASEDVDQDLITSDADDPIQLTETSVSSIDTTDEDLISESGDGDVVLESADEDILSIDDGTFTELQNKINDAYEGSVITLENNHVYNAEFREYGMEISKNLIIDGNGFILDGNNASRIFTVSANVDVIFRNIIFVNAKSGLWGAGAINGKATAMNCTFINNCADDLYASELYGGAIYEGSAVNCTFINNSAWYGGAIYKGDAVNCSFIGNSARYGGGAIYEGNATNCTFIANSDDFAGGINRGNAVNCIFINNTDRAIFNGDAVNCIFIGNSVSDDGGGAIHHGDAMNCTFIGNSARYGGAIYEGSAVNCTFTGNIAEYSGGAIDWGDAVNCTFIGNSAGSGGAIYYGNAVNCTFIGNSAINEGGAICSGDATTCKFINNSASESDTINYGDAKYCFFEGNEKPDSWYVYCHGSFILTQNGQYYKNKSLSVKLIDTDSNLPLANEEIIINFSNGYSTTVSTNSQGIATYSIPFAPGSYTASVSLINDRITINDAKLDNIVVNRIPGSLKLVSSGKYYQDVKLTLTLTNSNSNAPISGERIEIKFSNGKSVIVSTNSQGVATYLIPFAPGSYSLTANILSNYFEVNSQNLNNVKIVKASASLTPTKVSTTYGSGKCFQVKVINTKTKKPMPNVRLTLKVYSGKKYKTVAVTTDSKGIAKYSASTLALGKHKIIVSVKDTKCISAKAKTSSVKISKATLKISAPKVTNYYKLSGTFKVTVKNKASGKGMSGVKVNIKVYTGSNYKTYTIKTNSNGEASISTKSLTKTTHKIAVNVKGTSKYNTISAKSSVKIVQMNTHLVLADHIQSTVLGGKLDNVVVSVSLIDENGNVLTKDISAQVKIIGTRSSAFPYEGSYKETQKSNSIFYLSMYSRLHANGESTNIPMDRDEISSKYVEVTYEGDSTYKGCSAKFYF